eukprot:CAMPEP_0201687024 /NCGR_PEP_ID=MMETSP0578-20130828/1247_1 /ASSEMBLY_ACC=CAM_ASM_000663 /TAXON_ID=267565 /ORGANISM="Skeletonema grethea, Strain CCMP 1804" /LENGTH=754 /DNA_ID=CAMNT_0048171141 /DNA_START=203 /DNA_END=2467 /DNA_ORIENTATION=-
MGNTTGKSSTHTDVLDLSGHGKKKLSEREATATWYRYGVSVTDVYDVVEVLGQGHMGEVFTVRRKASGHHSDQTREKVKENDIKKILDEENNKKEKKRISIVSTPSKKGIKAAANKMKKKMGSKKEQLSEENDSNLSSFIHDDVTPRTIYEPTKEATPRRSIIRNSISSPKMLELSAPPSPGSDTSNGQYVRANSANSTGSHDRRPSSAGLATKKAVHFQRTFAVKTILTSRIQKDQMDELVNEITIMRKLDHPYVLKLYEVYHVKRKLWLVTELLTGGDLTSRKHSEYATKNVIEQVLRALVYLHRMGVVHRDIKLENILYENNGKNATVRLIDFGLSRTFDRTTVMGDYARTPYTLTPEAATTGHRHATDKSDVWAVGVIAFIMLSGEFPFVKTHSDLKNDSLMERLKKGRFEFGITWKGRAITYQAKQFVTGCLEKDPSKRWTAKEALANLHENWAPVVDKIWDDWQAEVKKKIKPEFVRPVDMDDLTDDSDHGQESDIDDDSSLSSNMSGTSLLDEDNDEDPPPPLVDKDTRAKNIKQHVQKTVMLKNAEGPIDTNEDVKWKLEEVQRYANFGIMKKTILITMANTLDRSDVGKLREIFLEADTNGSGTITLKELIDAFRKTSPDIDAKQVEALFKGIDRDKSGHIHYAEFLAALAESHGLVTMDRLTEVFDRIDTEGKGYITHEDLKSILGSGYDKATVDKMIKEADVKNNGRIDYDELMQLMFSDPVQGDKLAESFDALASPSSFSDI